MTLTIPISAGATNYQAIVGSGLLDNLGERLTNLVRGPRCAVIADENSARLFAEPVLRSLRALGFDPLLVNVPAGEGTKSFEQLEKVCEEMAAAGFDRTSFVVALGGGVVGDLAGFVAAVYHRGIPLVHVPTTLLAQVDSSIGGKTAINLDAGKNLVGAVRQPVLVAADVETLGTLPEREFKQGFAEIIKHAVIADPGIFEQLQDFDRANLAPLVARNIEIKAAIVALDQADVSGERAILNFGHTIGHAVERIAGYGTFLHGEAVSLGMVAACEISVRKFGLPASDRDKVISALKAFNLPTKLPREFPCDQIMVATSADKKFERGEVRFVVTEGLGSARLTTDVTMEDIAGAVASVLSS